jgi:gliding-associated putative ABC transporter substrate-binding component GldG
MANNKIKNRAELLVYILAILAIISFVNYMAARWFKRVDLTEGKEYSVSSSTKKVLKNLDDIINVKVFFSKNLPSNLHKTVTDVKDILNEYEAFAGNNLKITWVDPATDTAEKQLARSYGIPELQLQTFEKDKQQLITGYLGIAVLYEDKKEALPVVQNLQNLEYDLTMAIMKVSRKSVPKVGIVKVDSMLDLPPQIQRQMQQQNPDNIPTEQKFQNVYTQLRNNYEVVTVDLSNAEPIDSTIKTLIVPGTATLTDKKLFEIDQFFMKGGNLIVLADAIAVSFQYGINAIPVESTLFNMLENYGVKVEKSLVLDASCGQVEIPQQVELPGMGVVNMNHPVPYPYFTRLTQESFAKSNPAVSPLSDVVFPWVSPLSFAVDSGKTGVETTVLAKSSEKSWLASGNIDLNPQQKWAIPPEKSMKSYNLAVYLKGKFKSYYNSVPVDNVTPGDTLSKIKLGASPSANRAITGSNDNGKLIVIGDADFVSGQNATQQNIAMLMNISDWFSLDDNLISIRTRAIKNRTIDSDMLKGSSAKPNIIRIINITLMPIVVIIIGLIIFMRRREVFPSTASAPSVSAPAAKQEVKE